MCTEAKCVSSVQSPTISKSRENRFDSVDSSYFFGIWEVFYTVQISRSVYGGRFYGDEV